VASVVCLQGRQQLTVAGWDKSVRPSSCNVPFYDTPQGLGMLLGAWSSYGTGYVRLVCKSAATRNASHYRYAVNEEAQLRKPISTGQIS
jgi:hypothetical protein